MFQYSSFKRKDARNDECRNKNRDAVASELLKFASKVLKTTSREASLLVKDVSTMFHRFM